MDSMHKASGTEARVALIERCARAAHEANRVYCEALGDSSQVPWGDAPEELRESARKGVVAALAGQTPEQLHQSWLLEKIQTGWVYGPVKDFNRKTHPCLLPYANLPKAQQFKDDLFSLVVGIVSKAVLEQQSQGE